MEYFLYNSKDFSAEVVQQIFRDIENSKEERKFVIYGSSEFHDKFLECLDIQEPLDQMVEFPISYFLNGKEIKSLKNRRKRDKRRN